MVPEYLSEPAMEKNQDNTDEGNIIDVEAELDKPQPVDNTESPAANSQSDFNRQLPLILAVVAMLSVAAGGVFGYQYWKNIAADLHGMQNKINETFNEQEKLNTQIKLAQHELAKQKADLEKQQAIVDQQNALIEKEKSALARQSEAMQLAVEQVSDKIDRSDNQWQIAEAEYLMRIANHRLTLGKDVNTALAALRQAEMRLRDSGDLGFIDVREQLAREIEQLKTVTQPDIVGIASNLQAMSSQVSLLKLAGNNLEFSSNDKNADNNAPSERNLDTILEDSWRGFRDLMVIRKHDKPVSAMLPPSQQFFLFQNLQLQLESARLALLRQEHILFKSSLETASEWLNAFFDLEDPKTRTMLDSLTQLQQQSFDSILPDISGSLNLLLKHKDN